MDELSPQIHEEVQRLSELGNAAIATDNLHQAVHFFHQALDILPHPTENWEASTWLFSTIGDCFYQNESWKDAIKNLSNALNCPDGLGNPFIHLRLGQCYYQLNDEKRALDELMRAYMGDGEEVFEGEPAKYLEFLRTRVAL